MNVLILLALLAQSPSLPDKQQPQALAAPSKTTPLAALPSPQVQASPQQTYQAPQADPVQPVVVLRAVPSVYAIQRQVVVQANPMVYSQVAYAAADPGCVQQQVVRQTVLRQQVVQHSAVVNHGVVQSVTVNHALGGGVGRVARAPRKIVTKQVTKQKRGLLGGLFGG